jgi:hypothetical protein
MFGPGGTQHVISLMVRTVYSDTKLQGGTYEK